MPEHLKKTILFVDDDPGILQGLRRMLLSMSGQWQMGFVSSAEEALKALAATNTDVIVSDIRMPGMDGAELLMLVQKLYPHVSRIVLSGQCDKETSFRAVGPTHQFLSKPCSPEALKRTLSRTFALRELLANEAVSRVISGIVTLPSPPQSYDRLLEELRCPNGSLARISQIIAADPAMAAKILQLVNSDFFGLSQSLSSIEEAVNYLGLETIRSLVLSLNLYHHSDEGSRDSPALMLLFQHSLIVAVLARQIANSEGELGKAMASEAFAAGLFHDIGKFALVSHCSEISARISDLAAAEAIPMLAAEQRLIGTTHAEVGAYLLGLWGLPDPIVEAVAYHHLPESCVSHEFLPLTAVHVANAMAHVNDCGLETISDRLSSEYIACGAWDTHLPNWKVLCHVTVEEALSDELQSLVR